MACGIRSLKVAVYRALTVVLASPGMRVSVWILTFDLERSGSTISVNR
jgi:hypothetical protein